MGGACARDDAEVDDGGGEGQRPGYDEKDNWTGLDEVGNWIGEDTSVESSTDEMVDDVAAPYDQYGTPRADSADIQAAPAVVVEPEAAGPAAVIEPIDEEMPAAVDSDSDA